MSALSEISDAAVVVEDGRVAWVGPDAELKASDAAHEVDCKGATLMPALVDSHTHVVWAGNRRDEMELRLAGADYEEIFAAGGGILSSVRQTRATSEEALFDQSRTRMLRMQRAGTTSFEIKSGYGLDLESELRQLRVARRLGEDGFRVRTTCLAAHAVPAEARGSEADRAAFVTRVCDEILPAVAAEDLADYCDVFCDRGAFTPEESRRVLQKAKALGMQLRVHANEFGHTGGALVAAELGAASADHLLHLDDTERRALREAGVVATLLPGTSLVLGKPFADGRALVEAEVAVAVATDCNPGSCPLENLAMILGLACFGCRLSPAEAICATTHNAAASLGLANEVGRIEVGLSADLLVLATDDPRDLVYHTGSPLIREVYRRGERVDLVGA
jgi:imidazolonepropionase